MSEVLFFRASEFERDCRKWWQFYFRQSLSSLGGSYRTKSLSNSSHQQIEWTHCVSLIFEFSLFEVEYTRTPMDCWEWRVASSRWSPNPRNSNFPRWFNHVQIIFLVAQIISTLGDRIWGRPVDVNSFVNLLQKQGAGDCSMLIL